MLALGRFVELAAADRYKMDTYMWQSEALHKMPLFCMSDDFY